MYRLRVVPRTVLTHTTFDLLEVTAILESSNMLTVD